MYCSHQNLSIDSKNLQCIGLVDTYRLIQKKIYVLVSSIPIDWSKKKFATPL